MRSHRGRISLPRRPVASRGSARERKRAAISMAGHRYRAASVRPIRRQHRQSEERPVAGQLHDAQRQQSRSVESRNRGPRSVELTHGSGRVDQQPHAQRACRARPRGRSSDRTSRTVSSRCARLVALFVRAILRELEPRATTATRVLADARRARNPTRAHLRVRRRARSPRVIDAGRASSPASVRGGTRRNRVATTSSADFCSASAMKLSNRRWRSHRRANAGHLHARREASLTTSPRLGGRAPTPGPPRGPAPNSPNC